MSEFDPYPPDDDPGESDATNRIETIPGVKVDLGFGEYMQIRKRRSNDDLYRFFELFDRAFGIDPPAPKKDAAKTSPLVKTGLDPKK